MSQQWWKDDDQLLAALGAALRSERGVPAEFIATGKAAFSWRGIDAEPATFSCDPPLEGAAAELAGGRSEPASLRHLTFTSGELTLAIEVTKAAILGQLVPPGPGRAQARTADGTVVAAVIDQGGGFTIRPVPPGSFRLCCHAANGTGVLTDWLLLQDPRATRTPPDGLDSAPG
jgi:hypothetical protein